MYTVVTPYTLMHSPSCSSLVPRPLPDFISQPWRKNFSFWERGYSCSTNTGSSEKHELFLCMNNQRTTSPL